MARLKTVKKVTGIRTKKTVHSLPCKLTHEEQRIKGLELAEQDHTLFLKQEERKKVVDGFKTEIEIIESNMTAMARVLRQGFEMRPIECREIYDYNVGIVQMVRLDTGEVVWDRQMNDDERQMTFTSEEDEVSLDTALRRAAVQDQTSGEA